MLSVCGGGVNGDRRLAETRYIRLFAFSGGRKICGADILDPLGELGANPATNNELG